MNLRALIDWYERNQRPLPWRQTRDPYPIWISEVMLQQTTVAAVLPFYARFLKSFPDLQSLAKSSIEQVYEQWAGLGYYSRARNLHRAAQQLVMSTKQDLFPASAAELGELPGFGPYTSRAVASFSFEDKVGVLDGNVIRVWSRYYGEAIEHWKNAEKFRMQRHLDELATAAFELFGKTSTFNQATMELGATICTTHKPLCLLCPLASGCRAFQENRVDELPLPKPRKKFEAWSWTPKIFERSNGEIAFVPSHLTNAPVLKNQLILPGEFKRLTAKPKKFSFKHTITHHEIFVTPQVEKASDDKDYVWIEKSKIKQQSPFQIIQRAIGLTLLALIFLIGMPTALLAAPTPATSSSTLTSNDQFHFLIAEGLQLAPATNPWKLKDRDDKKWTWKNEEDPTMQLVLQLTKGPEAEIETNEKILLRDYQKVGFDVVRHEAISRPEKGKFFELFDPIQKKQIYHYIFKNGHEVAQWLCLAQKDSKAKVLRDCTDLIQSFSWVSSPTLKTNSSKNF